MATILEENCFPKVSDQLAIVLERTELGPKTYFYCTKEKIPFLKVATNLDKIDFPKVSEQSCKKHLN